MSSSYCNLYMLVKFETSVSNKGEGCIIGKCGKPFYREFLRFVGAITMKEDHGSCTPPSFCLKWNITY